MAKTTGTRKKRTPAGVNPAPDGRNCQFPGCLLPGDYPAPAHRAMPPSFKDDGHLWEDRPPGMNDRVWFCLEHVREYNKGWDFFRGMSPEDVERFQREATTGHRSTKKMGHHGGEGTWKHYESLFAFIDEFAHGAEAPKKPKKEELPMTKERQALEVLELKEPVTRKEIKAQYKKLAKKYHPDVNGQEAWAVEKIKEINMAYNFLMEESGF